MAQTAAAAPSGNPLGGAQALEDRFEAAWQSGAFDSQNPKEAAQLQAERAADREPPQKTAPQQTQQAQPEPAAEPQAAEVDEPEYSSLDDYLTKSGLDPNSFYELPLTIEVGGKTSEVKLADLRKSFQQEADYTRKTQTLADERRGWEAQREQQRTQAEQQVKEAKSLFDLAHQQLLGEYQQINWNALRAENPAQWAVLNTEFNNRAAAIQQHLQGLQAKAQELDQQRLKDLKETVIPREWEKTLSAIPEWRDKTKFEAARSVMSDYARTLGFNDAELNGIHDHRFMRVLHDASRFAALQAQAPQRLKQVRAAPQMANPGARTARDPKVSAYTQARANWRKAPRDNDAAVAAFDQYARLME